MSARAGCRIDLWVEPRDGRPAVNPTMQLLLGRLRDGGAHVRVFAPELEPTDLGESCASTPPDLILLKTATTLGLALAAAAERRGARCLNAAGPTLRAHDKAAVVGALAAAGIPVPITYLTQAPVALQASVPAGGGWVTKPTRGVHGLGVRVHDGVPSTLGEDVATRGFVVTDGTHLVQQRIGGTEPDLKVYVADRRCFAGHKAFAPDSYARDEIAACALDEETTELVLRIGRVLGLTCYGVDLRRDQSRLTVVDVNPFPGFRGFPAAVDALLAEVRNALREHV
ncbi:MAG: hypothetical protein U0821_24705 [Chloroflexota bacterium]